MRSFSTKEELISQMHYNEYQDSIVWQMYLETSKLKSIDFYLDCILWQWQKIADNEEKQATIMFAHQEIAGCKKLLDIHNNILNYRDEE